MVTAHGGATPIGLKIVAQPTLAILTGAGASWTYTPAADSGDDAFEGTASVGDAASEVGPVDIPDVTEGLNGTDPLDPGSS